MAEADEAEGKDQAGGRVGEYGGLSDEAHRWTFQALVGA